MSVPSVGAAAPIGFLRNPRRAVFFGLLGAIVVLAFWIPDLLPWAHEYPHLWIAPIKDWVGGFMDWLVKEFDLGLFTFQEFTRGISWLMNWPLKLLNWSLWKGFEVNKSFVIPSVSWLGLSLTLVIAGYVLGGWRLAALNAACFAYISFFDLWKSSMMTLASIGIAVPLGCGLGLAIGILAYRHRPVERVVTPMLDFMQTIPVFAYLVPILFLFGFSPVSAMVATIIYAMPPMVRATILGFKRVSPEIVEFGRMAGCSPRQLTWKVMIPAARPMLMVGVNQVIMLSLNAVIIASLIGAGGLGFDVLKSLRTLHVGDGLEAGAAIVFIAVVLDRMTQAFATKPPPEHVETAKSFWRRHSYLIVVLVLVIGTLVASFALPWLHILPRSATVTTGPWWDRQIEYITINFYDVLDAIKTFLYLYILNPFKNFLLGIPWSVVVAFLAIVGWRLGGWRLAVLVSSLAIFIVINGYWEKAIITVYLIGIAVAISALIGIPLGILGSRNDRVSKILKVICDTLQTLPSFVYLVPVVMLFQVGDVPALMAVVAYAVVPAIRYTDHGLRAVPPALIEAAKAAGCTKRQIMLKVQFPLAFPEILLGINQTILLAISMLVITALVGTRDLGQEVYMGLARADTGIGIVAGVSVAFIAIISDRLLQAYAVNRKKALGYT